MRACSIDVGKVNLGVYVEEFSDLDSGKALYLKRVDLTEKTRERVTVDFLKRLFVYLDTIRELLNTCDYLIIEKQLRANPEAQFVDHALQSYFILQCPTSKVISFSSKNKTRLFDDSKMTKYQRKKWATIKAIEMMEQRQETEIVAYIKSLKKKDDVSDAICQLDAWKSLHYLGKKATMEKRTERKRDAGEEKAEKQVEKKSRKKKTEPVVPAPVSPESVATAPVTPPKKTRAKKKVDPPVTTAPVTVSPESVAIPLVTPPKKTRAKKKIDPPIVEAPVDVTTVVVTTAPVTVVEKKKRKKVIE